MYRIIDQNEQDDIIVSFFLAQEQDRYTHALNLERFDRMLLTLPEGDWRKKVQTLRDQTAERQNEVETIIAASETQLPAKERLDAAKLRLKAKEG